jgi:hypothetical protein
VFVTCGSVDSITRSAEVEVLPHDGIHRECVETLGDGAESDDRFERKVEHGFHEAVVGANEEVRLRSSCSDLCQGDSHLRWKDIEDAWTYHFGKSISSMYISKFAA